jgi:hypothetical protein
MASATTPPRQIKFAHDDIEADKHNDRVGSGDDSSMEVGI